MAGFLKFLWGLTKIVLAFFCFVFAYGYCIGGADSFERFFGLIPLTIGLLLHWRFWLLAIPAMIIGGTIAKKG